MRKSKLSYIAIVAMAIVFMVVSCKKTDTGNAVHVPDYAVVVAVIDGSTFFEFADADDILNHEEFINFKELYGNDFEKSIKLLEDIIKNPEKSGLLLKENIFAYSGIIDNSMTSGLIIPFNKKQFSDNLDIVGKDFGFPVSMFLRTKDDIQYFEPDKSTIIAYNEDLLIILNNESEINTFELAESIFNNKKETSILTDDDFNIFLDNIENLNLWISSNVFNKVEDFTAEAAKFEKLTGIDVANNYGHFHVKMGDQEIVSTQKIRYNESFNDIDIEKLIENSEAIGEIFQNPINAITNALGNTNVKFSIKDEDDADALEWESHDWVEMSEEELEKELEQLLLELEKLQ